MSDTPPDHPVAPPVVAVNIVPGDMACFQCGYNLRGQPNQGKCPECASPVMNTYRRWLIYAEPKWLGRLRGGITALLWGILILVIASLGMGVFGAVQGVRAGPPGQVPLIPHREFMVIAALAGVSLYAFVVWLVFRLTTPEPRDDSSGIARREGAAWWAVVLCLTYIGIYAVSTPLSWILLPRDPMTLMSSTHYMAITMGIGLLSSLIALASLTMLLIHLRSIARRDHSTGTGRLLSFVAWGNVANCLTVATMLVFSMSLMSSMTVATTLPTATSVPSGTIGGSSIQTASSPTSPAAFGAPTPFSPAMPVGPRMLVFPIMALGECFGFIWMICAVIAFFKLRGVLSFAIQNNQHSTMTVVASTGP